MHVATNVLTLMFKPELSSKFQGPRASRYAGRRYPTKERCVVILYLGANEATSGNKELAR